jgi:glycerol-3-phosphate dehydrogenase
VNGPAGTPALDRRRATLTALADEPVDLLVVGGGIVGCGILLDAVSRGLRAALIEQEDIAVGTSSRSSRLIHGGLRYLAQLRVGLIRESLAERARLLRLAPHLVSIEPLLFPVYGVPLAHRAFYGAGLTLYDLLGASRDGGRSRHLTAAAALEITPVLRRKGLRGAIRYHDAVEDDARFAVAVARTAIESGGLAVTRVRAEGPLTVGGRTAGVRARDLLSDASLSIRARAVIDATGVWAAASGSPFGVATMPMVPSRGAHLVVRRDRIPSRTGLSIRMPGQNVFVVPWPGHWIIGTTDAPDPGSPAHPRASAAEVDELLAAVNRRLDVGLRRDDVLGTYAGLRPLVGAARGGSTKRVSREHRVHVDASGLVHVSGGKYTTYRVMAADAVDGALGETAARRPSATAELPLIGAAPRSDLSLLAAGLAERGGIGRAAADRLVARHGTLATRVVSLGEAEGLVVPLGPRIAHLEAEVAWAVREELALSLDDVMARRTRLAMELPDRGAAIAPRVAELIGAELGWDAERQAAEVTAYLASATVEYGVPGG